jgi:hypothetical protein
VKAPSGPEHGSDRQLLCPGGAPHEEKVAHIGAGDQKHEGHGRPQDEKDRPGVGHRRFVQRHDRHTVPFIRVRVVDGQALGDGAHLGLGLPRRHARLQARYRVQVVMSTSERVGGLTRQRPPQGDLRGWESEGCGHDAHDRVADPVQSQRIPKDQRIASELVPPEAMAEDDDLVVSR